jgi:hypothetical protein
MIADKAGRDHSVFDEHVHLGMRPACTTTASSSRQSDHDHSLYWEGSDSRADSTIGDRTIC